MKSMDIGAKPVEFKKGTTSLYCNVLPDFLKNIFYLKIN